MRRLAFLPLVLLLVVQAVHSATYVSRATGNWNATGTWAIQRTGTITTSTASATVTGSGTLFTTELAVNNVLYTATGVAIGTVKSITNATTLVLTTNAASTNAGINYYATSPSTPSVAADVVTVNSPHTVTGNAAVTITSVTINSGGTLTQSSNLITSGALNVLGTFNITGGAMTFGGLVTITNGTWNNSGNRNVTLQGGLTFNGGTFTSGTGTLTFTNSQTIDGTTGLTFSGTVSIASSIVITNKNDGVVRTVGTVQGGNASSTWINDVNSTLQVEGAFLATGTLTASAVPNTVNYAGGAQTVKLPSGAPAKYYNLTLSGSGAKPMPGTAMTIANDFVLSGTASATAAQALTVDGDIDIGSGTTFNANIFSHSVKGDFTNSGTFTALSSTITFNGSATQTLTGSTTFFNATLNNSSGLSLAASTNMTLGTSGTLVLTSGKITTGSNFVITPRACNVPSVTRTTGWVNGNLRKAIPAGASTCTFEIGDANNYAPAVFTFLTGTGAGNLTASTTGADHPQTGTVTSGIDPSNSVNRYWTFTNGGVTLPAATGYTVSLNFINGSTVDVDSLASVGSYTVEQWDGASWFPTTVSASCTAVDGSHLCKTASSESGFGDFAIGGFLSGFNGIPGPFNVMETTASTSQILGRLYTKLAGATFQISVVAVDTTFFVRNTAPSTNSLTIDIIDSSGTPGTFDATTNCWSGWVVPITRPPVLTQTLTTPSWTSGGLTVTINPPVTRAVRDARIRITQTVGAATRQACSVDRFSIRPANFTISSTNAYNTSQSGAPTVRTGGNFQLTATAVQSNGTTAVAAGYDGTPAIDNSKIIGSPNAGTIGGNFNAANGSAASGSTFYYSEVGNLGLNIGGVFDSSYTSVDQSTDCVGGDFSNTLSGGKYGCSIGNALIAQSTGVSGFGRFIPDNFAISVNAPQFSTTCGTFSYVGQSFTYTTGNKPVITVTARTGTNNGLGNATTLNYANSNPSYQYMKFSNSDDPLIATTLNKSPYNSQSGRYTRFDALGGGITPTLDFSALPATTDDPTIGTFTNGVGTLTFSDAGLSFTRSAPPSAPFNADIALAIKVIDTDGVEYASNPVTFGSATSGGGIAFSSGKPFRFGILRLLDAFAPLSGFSGNTVPIGMRAEYWTGTAFARNTLDGCTTLSEQNFVLYAHGGQITATNLKTPTGTPLNNGAISLPSATLSAGLGRVNVAAPGGINAISQPGNARICLDLDASSPGNDSTCAAPTPGNKAYLQGIWSGTSYNKDPNARIGFGVYGAQPNNFIYFREIY